MGVEAFMRELKDIKDNPELLDSIDTEMEKVLKEIIKIERRYLYGLDSTSHSKRKEVVKGLLVEKLKNKGR
jgi:hypothetical protein